MANQEQNPPQQEQPFVDAKQVGFNLEDIILNTNNEVALLYLEHNNKDHFKCVSDFISKYCLRKPFTRSPNMYKEYLAEFWYSAKTLENSKVFFSTPTGGIYGEVGVNTFRNAIGAHYLPHFSKYVAPPSIDIVRPWVWEAVPAKGTLKNSTGPHVLADQTKSASEGLETVLTQPITGKGASSVANLDSPEDDPVIIVDDSDEDEDDEVHATEYVKTEDISVPKSSSPRSSQVQKLTNQVLILQSQKYKLELEKNK
ncbi:hypothetical protein Tco_1495885, partial [Tanacetum coccineum]